MSVSVWCSSILGNLAGPIDNRLGLLPFFIKRHNRFMALICGKSQNSEMREKIYTNANSRNLVMSKWAP